MAADRVLEWRDHEREHGEREHDERQGAGRRVGGGGDVGPPGDRAVDEVEAGEADDDAGRDHFWDVSVDVVAEFVGEDDVDFFGREFF